MTTSTSGISNRQSPRQTACPPHWIARSIARSKERFAIKIERAPFFTSDRTQHSAIWPAPMTMIDCRDRSSRVFSTNSTAVLLIETVPRPIQNAAGQSGVASDLVGVFDLAGDFSFTEHQRVQARRDAKQMPHGCGVLV